MVSPSFLRRDEWAERFWTSAQFGWLRFFWTRALFTKSPSSHRDRSQLSMSQSFKEYQGSSLLITGGLGFIGGNLARRLIKIGGVKVFIVDAAPARRKYSKNLRNFAPGDGGH